MVPLFSAWPCVRGRDAQLQETTTLRYLTWAFRAVVFVLLLGFALKNSDHVTVRFYPGTHWEAPLALVALVFFTAGVLAGFLGCLAHMYRLRHEILRLRKELRAKPDQPSDLS